MYILIFGGLMREPFDAKHLSYRVAHNGCKVHLVEVDGGYNLVVVYRGDEHVLHAQRGHPRIFKNLDRATSLLRRHKVTEFSVFMMKAVSPLPPEKPHADEDIPF
jgi:hypothetical protein